jgi:alanyl-tRNA synthetase
MQPLKPRFENPDHTGYGNIQDCLRTNDIDEVGDGTHLTFFRMIGSFGFGTHNYGLHAELWHSIVTDLTLPPLIIHCHPDAIEHHSIWKRLGYEVRFNPECKWSDGAVGGLCSEMFLGDLEIGNLVNPLGHSVDVGFGYERLYQVMYGVSRVDETDLFRQDLDPVSRDHFRSLCAFYDHGIVPGNKGRNYVCRRLLRRFMRRSPFAVTPFMQWVSPEKERFEKSLREAQKYYRRNGQKPVGFWWDTFGILSEELQYLG